MPSQKNMRISPIVNKDESVAGKKKKISLPLIRRNKKINE
jgi:hypothetical protein